MILSGKITKSVREQDVIAKWHIVNAEGKTLGRLASQVAFLIRGKHKPDFTPHVDCGDFVVVINAAQIKVKGKREEQKEYFHYTGYPGGDRYRSFKDLVKSKPEEVIELAVRGMLPKNTLGRKMGKNLKYMQVQSIRMLPKSQKNLYSNIVLNKNWINI